jgi:hypothetical protein
MKRPCTTDSRQTASERASLGEHASPPERRGPLETGWRKFKDEVDKAGPNVYLEMWWRCMCELEGFGWLTNGGVHMDLPAGAPDPEKLLPLLGAYIDNCITPLRRLFAWGAALPPSTLPSA